MMMVHSPKRLPDITPTCERSRNCLRPKAIASVVAETALPCDQVVSPLSVSLARKALFCAPALT